MFLCGVVRIGVVNCDPLLQNSNFLEADLKLLVDILAA